MKHLTFHGTAALTAVVLSALTAVSASANCGINKDSSPAAYQMAVQSFERIKAKSDALQSAMPAEAQLSTDAPLATTPSIVGLWHTIFLLDPKGGYFTAGPNVFDEGFDQWHSDGTETLNDISPPPTGNVCLGAWTQTGPLTYSLKHPTWLFDPSNTTIVAVGTISEQVTLDPSGNTYSGTATFDILDLTGASQGHLSTAIMAERIVADGQLFQPTPGPAITTAAVVTPSSLTTNKPSTILDGSGSTGTGPLTYFYSVLPGGKVPALLQTPSNPKVIVQFVNGPGTYIVQLKVIDSAGHSAVSQPVMLVYTGN
ncbi:MAG TPA: hypothetical protein VEU96_06945 [Bryobacteraceae bacterium]|nr:hypothetical protein [Bryobacteraceae bacterium]